MKTSRNLSGPYVTKASQCLILAAGKGTRLRKASHGLPKPLVHFRGKPILEHIILAAHQAGINRFVIVVGYGSELIRRWFNQPLSRQSVSDMGGKSRLREAKRHFRLEG